MARSSNLRLVSAAAVTVATLVASAIACSGEQGTRAFNSGLATEGSTAQSTGNTPAVQPRNQTAVPPVPVTGNYLTMDVDQGATTAATATATATGTDAAFTIDIAVKANGTAVALGTATAQGQLLDGNGTQVAALVFTGTTAATTVQITAAMIPTYSVQVSLGAPGATSAGQQYSGNLRDYFGTPLTELTGIHVFDFTNYQSPVGFQAADFCNASGVLPSPSQVVAGATIPFASWEGTSQLTFANSGLCFENIGSFYGTTATSLFAPKDDAGTFVAAGPTAATAGGTPACSFVVIAQGKSGASPRLVVVPNSAGQSAANLRFTAALSACPD